MKNIMSKELVNHITAEEIIDLMQNTLNNWIEIKLKKNNDYPNAESYLSGGIDVIKHMLHNVEFRANLNKELNGLSNQKINKDEKEID